MSAPAMSEPLAPKDANASISAPTSEPAKAGADGTKSMEYHRQMLQNKLGQDQTQKVYISPSDTIMSPCTKKLSDYKAKHLMKAKPQSLFAKMEAQKKLRAEAEPSTGAER